MRSGATSAVARTSRPSDVDLDDRRHVDGGDDRLAQVGVRQRRVDHVHPDEPVLHAGALGDRGVVELVEPTDGRRSHRRQQIEVAGFVGELSGAVLRDDLEDDLVEPLGGHVRRLAGVLGEVRHAYVLAGHDLGELVRSGADRVALEPLGAELLVRLLGDDAGERQRLFDERHRRLLEHEPAGVVVDDLDDSSAV